jgi:hypothetical protein
MKNNPLTTILLAVLAISAVWSVVLCGLYVRNTRDIRTLQAQAQFINYRQAAVQSLAKAAVEYSKTHPDINPLLEAAGIVTKPVAGPGQPPTR